MRNGRLSALVLSATLVLAGCTVWGEHPVRHWKDATGGEGLERNYWSDVKDKQWDELERHLATNYVSFTPEEGRLDRDAALEHVRKLRLDDYSLGNFQVELNGETMVVTYTIAMRGEFAGQPVPAAPVRMMTVWQHEKPGWLAIAHTVIGPEQK